MPQPTLPPELIGVIIKHLGEARSADRLGSLSACCLVARDVLPFARDELYREVRLEVCPEQAEDPLPLAARQLLNTLTSSPHLASIVTILRVVTDSSSMPETIPSIVGEALDLCLGVEVLDLDVGNIESAQGWVEEMIMQYRGTLVSLDVGPGYDWIPPLFAELLGGLPALRELQLGSIYEIELSTPIQQRLHGLTVFSPVDVELLDKLIGGSRQSLKSLCCVGFGPDQSFNFSAYTSLKDVEIYLHLDIYDKTDIQHLFTSINALPSLRTLSIDLFGQVEGDIILHLSRVCCLHHFPSTLRRLDGTSWLPLPTPYLLSILTDRTSLPTLEQLGLHRDVLGDDSHLIPRPRGELDQIQAAADARGVEIIWSEETTGSGDE